MIQTARLADLFVEAADALVAELDLVAFLQDLTDAAAEVSGAGAVGLVLADRRGLLRFMAASNDSGRALELYQLQAEEGPCLDCYRTRRPVVNADLATADRQWPRFAPRAQALGFASVHAFPLRLGDDALGALNLFGTTDTRFDPDEVRIVQALADVATLAILHDRRVARSELLTEQLQGALNDRVTVEQARGALAEREGIDVGAAFTRLRERAAVSGRRVAEEAAEVIAGR
ncbi:GAF and ANTAR domain-containing protein [Nocardioides lentus]|uniref:GAF and ANTAR domain-containing protein n=1 Tax=Nocardioides lentus TaxID=338077 RepID=A0ABP5AMV0_9ACTN